MPVLQHKELKGFSPGESESSIDEMSCNSWPARNIKFCLEHSRWSPKDRVAQRGEPQMARSTAISAKVCPNQYERWRRDDARIVSETRSCAAHRFYCGPMSLSVQAASPRENRRETRRIWLIVVQAASAVRNASVGSYTLLN